MKTKVTNFRQNIKDFFYVWGNILGTAIVFILIFFSMYIAIIPNPIKKAKNEKKLYHNEKFVIIGTNENTQDFTHDKFHKPIVVKVWLIQRVSNKTQFAELSSYNNGFGFYITKELWYSKGIGDTLYFKYIRKNRFFTINKK